MRRDPNGISPYAPRRINDELVMQEIKSEVDTENSTKFLLKEEEMSFENSNTCKPSSLVVYISSIQCSNLVLNDSISSVIGTTGNDIYCTISSRDLNIRTQNIPNNFSSMEWSKLNFAIEVPMTRPSPAVAALNSMAFSPQKSSKQIETVGIIKQADSNRDLNSPSSSSPSSPWPVADPNDTEIRVYLANNYRKDKCLGLVSLNTCIYQFADDFKAAGSLTVSLLKKGRVRGYVHIFGVVVESTIPVVSNTIQSLNQQLNLMNEELAKSSGLSEVLQRDAAIYRQMVNENQDELNKLRHQLVMKDIRVKHFKKIESFLTHWIVELDKSTGPSSRPGSARGSVRSRVRGSSADLAQDSSGKLPPVTIATAIPSVPSVEGESAHSKYRHFNEEDDPLDNLVSEAVGDPAELKRKSGLYRYLCMCGSF